MKNLILLLSILLYGTTTYSQSFYMNGRFSNTTPDVNQFMDSAIFVFTNTEYAYYINTNSAPLSYGTYMVDANGSTDTLVLVEDSLGVCSPNGTGTTIKLRIDKTTTPFYSITLIETAASQDSCPSHSGRMYGDFIAWDGVIIDNPNSVKNTNSISVIKADVYDGSLRVTSQYDEKASIDVINTGGQIVMKPQPVTLKKGQVSTVSIDGLSTGIYFVRIRSEHEMKVVKFAR